MNTASSGRIPSEKHPLFPVQKPGENMLNKEDFMRTGLTKKQKITELFFNEKDNYAEVYTHNTALKKRLLAYAEKFPELCKQTDDDEQGGLRFEIDKNRISLRLTAPYSTDRRNATSQLAKKNNTFSTQQR